jgi:mannose-1-phosphate guanylyltransferase
MRVAVIMAGGSGERFWPLSRKQRPKQLLRLTDPNRTMLEEAVDRVAPLVGRENVYIATASHLATPIRKAGIVATENVIAEPDKRNTLGCLSWVAANLEARHGEDVTLVILTADHKVQNDDEFRDDLALAITVAEEEKGLVTLGINPTRPETGYGYIECGEAFDAKTAKVTSFREKPDLATAQEFLASGKFVWNSGMFIWTLSAFSEQLTAAQPEAAETTNEICEALKRAHVDRAAELFKTLPNLSIDYALMEKATKVYTIRTDFPWDDVGAFDALLRTMEPNEEGNVILGEVVAVDCKNSILYNDSKSKLLSAVGLRDMMLVQTDDAVMAAPLGDAQRVKEIVGKLQGSEYL